jgi:endoglucanase
MGNRTVAQKEAARWLADNVSSHQVIYMDSYAWVDLREPSFTRGKPLLNAHYYWPGTADPAVRFGVLNDDWRNIDYLAFSPNIEADIQRRTLPLLPDALAASDPVRAYTADDWTITINRIRKLVEEEATSNRVLTESWASYVHRFIDSGRVIDPKTDRSTTSEGQAYAMLRAVYMNDRATFDRVWSWTKTNLQVRGDSLFSWKWGARADGSTGVLDPNAATDADQDIALALLFAGRRWSAPDYQKEAMRVLDGIWDQETVVAGGRRILVAGDWARGDRSLEVDSPIVNPSYLAPYAYRIFAAADPSHPWLQLVDSSYDILARVRPNWALGGPVGIVPDWLSIDSRNGDVRPADVLGDKARRFSFESARLPWRLAMDWYWFKDNRAKEASDALFLLPREISQSGRMAAAYSLDGAPKVEYESISIYAGALGTLLLSGDGSLAHKVFANRILGQYVGGPQGGYWGDPDNYFDQNWGWFGTALMHGALGNLWAGDTTMDWERPYAGPVAAAQPLVPTPIATEFAHTDLIAAPAPPSSATDPLRFTDNASVTLPLPRLDTGTISEIPSRPEQTSETPWLITVDGAQIFSISDGPLRSALPDDWYYLIVEEDEWALVIWDKDPPTWPVWVRRASLEWRVSGPIPAD